MPHEARDGLSPFFSALHCMSSACGPGEIAQLAGHSANFRAGFAALIMLQDESHGVHSHQDGGRWSVLAMSRPQFH